MYYRENFIGLLTIIRKEIVRIKRMWPQTLLPPIITSVLYFVIFGRLIGSQIQNIHGFSYMQFIVPGLIMMSVVNNAYSNVSSSFYLVKFQRNVDELLVSPLPDFYILIGFICGGVLRGLVVGSLVLIIALFFTPIPLTHSILMLLVAILTAFLFACGGFLNGLLANKFDDVTIIPTFVLTPLVYLGGVFFSISMLHGFWRGLAEINPILYIIDLFRFSMLGISDISVWFAFAMILLTTVLLFLLCWYLLHRGTGLKS